MGPASVGSILTNQRNNMANLRDSIGKLKQIAYLAKKERQNGKANTPKKASKKSKKG